MTIDRRIFLPGVACCLVLATVQCAREPAPPVEAPEPVGLMNAAVSIDGWQLEDEPLVYVGDTLYELINGGAELYHQLGFVQAMAAEYVDADGRTLSLEVFEMGDVQGTEELFYEKTGGSGEPAAIGDEAAIESYYMNARVGRYLITITGFESDEATTSGMLELATAVASALGGIQ
jgi:hypothetical protein